MYKLSEMNLLFILPFKFLFIKIYKIKNLCLIRSFNFDLNLYNQFICKLSFFEHLTLMFFNCCFIIERY